MNAVGDQHSSRGSDASAPRARAVRVLLVLHEATRTGAPVVAATLVEHLRDRFEFEAATLIDGPFRTPLSARMWSDHGPSADVDVAWCNGAAAAAVLWDLDDAVPAIVFAHEMGEAFEALSEEAIDALRSRCEVVIAVSEAARSGLIRLGVRPDRIELVEPPVAVPRAVTAAQRERARAECGAADGTALVVCCGEAAWRKGPDLFVHAAAQISVALDGKVRFAWIGRRSRSIALVVDHDAELLGVRDHIRWLGETSDAAPYLAAADLVLLPSREDPHPLVPAEAALVGTATAAFDAGGWRAAPVGDCCAERSAESSIAFADTIASVDYPDVNALAAAAVGLLRSPEARSTLAERAARYVSDRQSPEHVARRFGDILDRVALAHDDPNVNPDEESE